MAWACLWCQRGGKRRVLREHSLLLVPKALPKALGVKEFEKEHVPGTLATCEGDPNFISKFGRTFGRHPLLKYPQDS